MSITLQQVRVIIGLGLLYNKLLYNWPTKCDYYCKIIKRYYRVKVTIQRTTMELL